MKKVLTISLCLCLLFGISTHSSAISSQTSEYNVLKSEVAEFGYNIESTSLLRMLSNIKNEVEYTANGAEIITHLNMFTDVRDIRVNLELPAGAYIAPMSALPEEKNTILIFDSSNKIIGAIEQAYIIDNDGTKKLVDSTVEGKDTIAYSFDKSVRSGKIVSRIYVQRNWSYYFTNRGYNGGGAYHDFYMTINRLNFNTDIAAGYSVLAMSWDAINREMSSYLTGSDRTKWVNNTTTLYNQYDCHYFGAIQTQDVWNLEEWRPIVSWATMVSSGCNPT